MNKIAVYLISDGMGGAEQVVWEIAKGFSKSDSFYLIVNNEIAAYYQYLLPENRFFNIGNVYFQAKIKNKFGRFLFNNRFFSLIPWVIRFKTLKIVDFLLRNKISLIHSHLDFTLYSSLKIKTKLKDIKIYHSVHSAYGLLDNKNLKPSISLTSLDFKSVNKLIFVSNYVCNLYKSNNIHFNDFKVIYNGISHIPEETYFREEKQDNEFEILFLGGSKYVKGYDILIETVEILNNMNLNTNFHVVILGIIGNNLIKMIEQRGLEKLFRLKGFINPPAQFNYFKSADILFMPSRSEVLPLAAIEALFYDIPIVANKIGGLPEIIEHNRNGLLGNNIPHEYAKQILHLMINYNKFLNIMKDFNNKRKKQFDAKLMCKSLSEIY
jgi:glycosyltransferase involved in cell wall biosynthesis